MKKLWDFLNKPFIIVIASGLMGWVFVNFIWEPHKIKVQNNEKRFEYQKEAHLRLDDIDRHLSKNWLGLSLDHLIDGADPLNPGLKDWSLRSLVFSGWDQTVYDNTILHIDSLQIISDYDTIEYEDQISKIRLHLNFIKTCLTNDEK